MQAYKNKIKIASKIINKLPSHKLDSNVDVLKKAFDTAYENDIFALYKYDKEKQEELKLKLFSKLTPISGSLSFLAIQILAANSIMNKTNFHKRDFYFKQKCGIAINHLRVNETVVSATKCQDGYKLNGILTWASGYKIFDTLLIGFHYENKEYEVISDFKKTHGFNILSTPKTFVAQSLNTINIELKDFFVKEENIVSSNEIGNYTRNKSLSKTIHYSLYSLGKGAVKHIENKRFQTICKNHLKEQKQRFINSSNPEELDAQRIELFNLVQKIITVSMINNGGKSILQKSHFQRYYRELIMFNSNGLNTNIKDLFTQDFIK